MSTSRAGRCGGDGGGRRGAGQRPAISKAFCSGWSRPAPPRPRRRADPGRPAIHFGRDRAARSGRRMPAPPAARRSTRMPSSRSPMPRSMSATSPTLSARPIPTAAELSRPTPPTTPPFVGARSRGEGSGGQRSPRKNGSIITSHDAFGYFDHEYGMPSWHRRACRPTGTIGRRCRQADPAGDARTGPRRCSWKTSPIAA